MSNRTKATIGEVTKERINQNTKLLFFDEAFAPTTILKNIQITSPIKTAINKIL